MKYILFIVFILGMSELSYSQKINTIIFDYTGMQGYPIPTLILRKSHCSYSEPYIYANPVIVKNKSAFVKTVHYFNQKNVEKISSSIGLVNMFHVLFYRNKKLKSEFFIDKKGFLYFLTNLPPSLAQASACAL